MENYVSPLQKYKREPKLFIDLPSKGNFYPKAALEKFTELEVYSMTASDEMRLKTPDALYTGHAVVNTIQRCVPSIKDPWTMPIIDVDYVLAAIRLATYGENITINSKCPKCDNEDAYAIPVQSILDHYTSAKFVNEFRVDDFILRIRPLNYRELTEIQQKTVNIQRQLQQQVLKIEDEDSRQVQINKLFDEINLITISTIHKIVVEITTPDGDKEMHHQFISEFLENGEKKYFEEARKVYESNVDDWNLKPSDVACSECSHEYQILPNLDYSSFFARG
jgi:hypothetical protein